MNSDFDNDCDSERFFVTYELFERRKRFDQRHFLEGRKPYFVLGIESDFCIVNLGNTKVYASVEYKVMQPKASAPNEGTITVEFDRSSIFYHELSESRALEIAAKIQRCLERCIVYSKAVDLEALCIVPGSTVLSIEVKVEAAAYDGNLLEATSIATITALAHTRIPEIITVGEAVHFSEKSFPLPINFHLIPITVNLAFFNQDKLILVDPLEDEEKFCDISYVVDVNVHQEMFYVHDCYSLLKEDIQRFECAALKRAQELTEDIRAALDNFINPKKQELCTMFSNFRKLQL